MTAALGVLAGTASAAFIEMPDNARPGPVRPGMSVNDHIAEYYPHGADDARRPGPLRPGADDAFDVGERSFAGVVDLPDAARPGAIRPGEDRKLIPAPPPDEIEFEVPPLVDRPLEIDDGDKVVVTRFILEGAQDRADHDIAVADVQALLDARLAERPEGFTVGRMQEVADEITAYYRERGLILAQAFVPVQEVVDGNVRIQVMEGLLGRVIAEGNELYDEDTLTTPFRDIVGQPVTKEAVESALLTVSDYPGQNSFGVFQPGIEVGTTDMVVNVQEEDRFEVALRADNHGITETGQNRYLAKFTLNNPLRQADRFDVTVQQTAVPDNTFFWALDYEVPMAGFYDTWFTLSASRNQFDVGGTFRNLNIASDIRNYNASVRKDIIRSRLMNLDVGLRVSKKRSRTKASGRPASDDSLAVASLELNFDSVDARFGGLNAGYLELSHGFNNVLGAMGTFRGGVGVGPSRQVDTGEFAEGHFDKAFLSLSRFQALTPIWDKLVNHNLLFTFEALYSPDLLVPLEQYTIGGPTNVRGYRPTEALFDRAVFGSIEWIINAPFIADQPAFGNRTWGELMQLSFFYDMGAGKLNGSLANEDRSENYKSVGFALSFNNPKVFSGKISIASPIGDPEPENEKQPQYWVDLNFFF